MSAQEEQPVEVIDLEDQEEDEEPNEEEEEEPNEEENYLKPRKPVQDDRYYVERVVDKKVEDGELMYFVKWLGYDESQNTWETMDNLDGAQEALIKFEDKLASSSKKGAKTFPVASEHINDKKCRRDRARMVRELELIEVMCFFPDTCRFVVKYDDNSCVLLQPAEYAALPLEKKEMFPEFLAKIYGDCASKIMNHYKKKVEIEQRAQVKKKTEVEANKKKNRKQVAEEASAQSDEIAARCEVDNSLSHKLKDAMSIYEFEDD